MKNLAHVVFWQNKIFQTGTSLISTSLDTKKKLLPCVSVISLFLVWSLDIQALHRVYMLTFVNNDNSNADADNHTQKGD